MCIYTPITRHLFADGVRRLLIIALFVTTLLFISLCNEMCVRKWNCRVMKGMDHQFVSLVLMIPTSGHAFSPHSVRRVQYFHPLLRVVSCLLKERMLRNVYFFSAPPPCSPTSCILRLVCRINTDRTWLREGRQQAGLMEW